MGDRVAADTAGCALRVVVGWCLVLTGLLVPAPSGAVEPVRVMIVGDSVTQGSSGDWTWRYRLWQHFQAAGVAVDFVGPREDLFDNVNGVHGSMDYLEPDFDRDHAARWGQSLEVQDFRITDLVNEFEPDVVVEMLGVNDLTWGGAEPATVANRLREFAADARAADPSVGLVLARAPQTWGTGVPEFNELVDDVAAEWDDPDARAVSAAPDEGFRHYDDTWDPAHANAHGEELIAGAIADALASLGIGPLAIRPVDEHPLGPRVAPTLAVAPGDHRAVLSWTGPPGATGQYVWVSDRTVGEEWRRLPYSVSGGTWTDEGLDNGHTYAFRLQPVKGYWAAADDIRSNVSTVTPQPPAPAQPARPVVSADSHRLRVQWPSVTGAGRYRVAWWPCGRPGARNTKTMERRSIILRSLVAGRQYAVSVQAGNDGGWGRMSAVAEGVPAGPRAAAPGRLRIAQVSGQRVRVTWQASEDATRYEVQRRRVGSGWVRAAWTTRTSATTDRLRAGRRWTFRVQAWHQLVPGGRSGTLSLTMRPD